MIDCFGKKLASWFYLISLSLLFRPSTYSIASVDFLQTFQFQNGLCKLYCSQALMTVLAFQFSQQEELASTLFFPRKIYCCFQEFILAVFLAGAMGLGLEPSANPSFANLNNTELIFLRTISSSLCLKPKIQTKLQIVYCFTIPFIVCSRPICPVG